MKTLAEIGRAELIHRLGANADTLRAVATATDDTLEYTGQINGVSGKAAALAQETATLAERWEALAKEARPKPTVEITERRADDSMVEAIRSVRAAGGHAP